MLQSEIKSSFVELGNFVRQFSEEGNVKSASVLHNDLFFDDFANLIELSQFQYLISLCLTDTYDGLRLQE